MSSGNLPDAPQDQDENYLIDKYPFWNRVKFWTEEDYLEDNMLRNLQNTMVVESARFMTGVKTKKAQQESKM